MQSTKTNNISETLKKSTEKISGQSRLNFRLAPEIKERVARAASLSGQDLTEFAVATLVEKADEVIKQYDQILLSGEDYHFFLEALSATEIPPPSERSLKAATRYRQGTRKGVRHQLAD